MTLINERLLFRIKKIIKSIENEYQKTQGMILTEADLQCILYRRLAYMCQVESRKTHAKININGDSYIPQWKRQTIDEDVYATSVHTEIPWFDEKGNLTIYPDITILEPNRLSILHGLDGPTLPSKQSIFGGQGIIFELKFCRNSSGITPSFLQLVKDDFLKIQNLFGKLSNERRSNDMYCFFVIFNKTNEVCSEFLSFYEANSNNQHWRMIYATGNVRF